MHGWDYLLLALTAATVLGIFFAEPHELSEKTLRAFGDYAAIMVAIFGIGLCLVLDEVIVGHSLWLYVIGGIMMGIVVLSRMLLESEGPRSVKE